MSKHTPGEWYAKREGFSTVYVFSRIGGGLVQEVAACGPTNGGVDQQEANARLIAAAPDLLQALKLVRDYIATMKRPGHEYIIAVDSAITKAE